MTDDCVQRAYLYLERDHDLAGPPFSVDERERMAFDPDAVTALTGLTPTRVWRRGEPGARPGHSPRRTDSWAYGPGEVRTLETEPVVTALLDVIEPYAAGIGRACRELDMRAGIMVVIRAREPAIAYRAGTLRRLARMNLELVHDQYAGG